MKWGAWLLAFLALLVLGAIGGVLISERFGTEAPATAVDEPTPTPDLRQICEGAVDLRDRLSDNPDGAVDYFLRFSELAKRGNNAKIKELASSMARLSSTLYGSREGDQDQRRRDFFSMLGSLGEVFDECEAQGVIVPGMPTESNEGLPVPE